MVAALAAAVSTVAALAAVVLAVGSATVSAEDLATAFTAGAFTVGMAATIRVTMGTAITRTAITVTERDCQTERCRKSKPGLRGRALMLWKPREANDYARGFRTRRPPREIDGQPFNNQRAE